MASNREYGPCPGCNRVVNMWGWGLCSNCHKKAYPQRYGLNKKPDYRLQRLNGGR